MKEPIRVLNLFTIMNRGGAETMVMNYYRNIDRTKVQFDFLVHRDEKGAYDDEILSLGGKIYHMIPIYPQNFLTYKKMLREFFNEHKEYKIIHSHMSELGYFAFKEAKKQGIPIRICHAHSYPHQWDIKMIMRTYFKIRMMPYLTHMFTCGIEAGKWLYGKKNEKNFIQLNNAIDSKKFIYNKELEFLIRKELKIENKLVVGHVGRFTEEKNHVRIVDIFEKIQEIKKDAILILIGDGPLKIKIEQTVKKKKLENKVLFLGVRPDIDRLLQSFDLFLFPSVFEGLPVSVIEAQAAGLQCFISDVIPEQCIISDNVIRFSLLDDDKNIAHTIINMNKIYKKENMYEIIKKNGFDIQNNAKILENFYINESKKN